MKQISRRAFVGTGAAASLASAAGIGAMPASLTGRPAERRSEHSPTTVKFTGDGQSLSPLEYSQALASIIDGTGVAPDYYSRGGVVRELEDRIAAILGKERAVFLATGTLANHLAVRIQARDRSRVIVQEDSHLYCDSGDCAEVLSNLNLVTLARGAGTFTLEDFLDQMQTMKKMGPLKDLMGMIPGVGKAIKNMDIDDDAFKGIEAIIYSMTQDERENPTLLNGSRRKRIADGSGTSIQEVNRLLKQFSETRKMMKMVSQGKNLQRVMGNMNQRKGF